MFFGRYKNMKIVDKGKEKCLACIDGEVIPFKKFVNVICEPEALEVVVDYNYMMEKFNYF